MTSPAEMGEIFGPDGLLADLLPDYEYRSGQRQMALAVAKALTGGMLAVEAETGIGKTLAYLIPAVLSRQKIVISTGTLNLQEQILTREIPFIRQHIDPELKALGVKGRRNYLCLYRWQQAAAAQASLFVDDAFEKITAWLQKTRTGDRAELPWLPDDSELWPQISSTTSQCPGASCPAESTCFVSQLRKKAAAARLIITNHHLFFSDLALRRFGYGEVLPRYESVIFDEAHHLEAVATQYFGRTFSHYQLLDLVKDIDRLAQTTLAATARAQILQAANGLTSQAEHFAALFPGEKGRFPLADFIAREPAWEPELQALADRLTHLGERLDALALDNEAWQILARRRLELFEALMAITAAGRATPAPDDAYVRWYEKRERSVTLTASPIEVAAVLAATFYDKIKSCVFTSATLTAGGGFDFFLARLGLDHLRTETAALPSPFDYANRTLLYIPACGPGQLFPQPGDDDFASRAGQCMYEILLATRGRALVLFTSISAMRNGYRDLADRLPYPVLMQGEAPKNILLDLFKKQTNSVLLAVASFWEGVNVPGESLSCVIIEKLPFEVPSDPVIMARIDKIKKNGGHPFFEFQVPRAILALRQGLGRLMRATTDQGLLAILDVRLFTKGYGRLFRESLPASPITRELADVRNFFREEQINAS